MRSFVRTVALLLLALWAPLAFAAAPGGVTGIHADRVNGKAHVTWSAAGGTVASYRIYYSDRSILGNGGDYDDYEETTGPMTQWTLKDAPTSGPLYVSVLAVNDKGEESPLFLEEASVPLSSGTATSQTTSQTMVPVTAFPGATGGSSSQAGTVFRLLSAQSLSATGVLLSFSHSVTVAAGDTATAFRITDAAGAPLPIVRFEIHDTAVLVHTRPQTRSASYRVQVAATVHGTAKDGNTQPVSISPLANTAAFTGSPLGSAAASSIAAVQPPQQSGGVTNLLLTPKARADGFYDVLITWTAPATAVSSYTLYQSKDDGKTYGTPQMLPAGTVSATIQGVPPGSFGAAVQGVRPDGTAIASTFQSIMLPAKGRAPLPAMVIPPAPQASHPLPSTGAGLPLVVVLAGAGAGTWAMRRKRQIPA